MRRPAVRRARVRWIWLSLLIVAAVFLGAAAYLISHAEPVIHARIVETLSTRFHSRVELTDFHVTLRKGIGVEGGGLRIFGQFDPNTHQIGMQPLISVKAFSFNTGISSLFRTPMHVNTVRLTGLQVNVPPSQQRKEMESIRTKGKMKVIVDELVCDEAQLIINTLNPDKLPLDFAIRNLTLTRLGSELPMRFNATLINPKPVGNIESQGRLGPWQADSPRDTPIDGTYSFSHADLGTIKGIGGMLSSTGRYSGKLDTITVDGETDTPDFRVNISGQPVPLHTDFHATVDGTTGDTHLEPVKARILHSSLVARGYVVKSKDPKGHTIRLDVMINDARIEDLLKLGVRTNPPLMTGDVRLHTNFDLPAGQQDISERLRLRGNFQVSTVHFNNTKIQSKVDALSMRSQGKPKKAADNVPDNVHSELSGTFALKRGVLSFSRMEFTVPGADINLAGIYRLDGAALDFRGHARMHATLSHMVGGWKSIFLKPVDPFFRKHGAGTELPVKITGTRSNVHFGLDFGRKDEAENR
ncbi:MAG TPA: AsmA-like C-terminal region-containing protein [Terriglobales bacterium]|nr:AsmA-like C-terminal region-containing protein [Terriglobales bacterium]